MKFLYYTLLISISGFISCTGTTDSQYPRYAEFPQARKLDVQEIPLDTILLRYPSRVAVQDSIAIIMDLHGTGNFFHAFRYPSGKHIVSFGKRGEAPEEILLASDFQFDSLDSIWILDANKMQMTRWEINPLEKSAKQQEMIALDKNLVRAFDFYRTDSCFYIPDYLGKFRYRHVDYKGKPTKNIGEIPTELHQEADSKPALAQSWRSFMDYNPDNGVLALATQLGEAIEIYNLKENTHYVAYGPNGEPKFKKDSKGGSIPAPEGILGFSDVVVTNQYIYAPFRGITFREQIEAFQQGKESEDGAYSIYVFDLQGNPVQKYELDKPINGIDINETIGTIIATCAKSDEPFVEIKI